jgi:ADP-ribosylglycohydrolase
MERARHAVEGLSLGDSFGQQFFYRESWASSPTLRELPPPKWRYTDDTEMALGVLEVLSARGEIEQDELAAVFGRRYLQNPARGYGAGAHEIVTAIAQGTSWRPAAGAAFGGQGSLGNGAAMRVAPVGAYWADDLEEAARQARRSAEVTHLHAEGVAGAIAVAVAAACAWQNRGTLGGDGAGALFEAALQYTPVGDVRTGIAAAARLPFDTWEFTAAERLGNGSRVRASDTVPFCLWNAARNMHDYDEALWTTAAVGGDIDTTCAIVGGIVALAVGCEGLPADWLQRRESLQWTS